MRIQHPAFPVAVVALLLASCAQGGIWSPAWTPQVGHYASASGGREKRESAGDGDKTEKLPKPGPKPAGGGGGGISEWMGRAEKGFDASAKGVDKQDVPFSITLVDGFTVGDDPALAGKGFELGAPDNYHRAGVRLVVSRPFVKELPLALQVYKGIEQKVVKEEKTARGFILHLQSDESLVVHTRVSRGPVELECRAELRHAAGPLAAPEAEVFAWFERLCTSLTIH